MRNTLLLLFSLTLLSLLAFAALSWRELSSPMPMEGREEIMLDGGRLEGLAPSRLQPEWLLRSTAPRNSDQPCCVGRRVCHPASLDIQGR